MSYYGYVYLTTNNINGKLYIGRHSNKWVRKNQKLDPKYKGSGSHYFKAALKKYGFENFSTKILEWCETEEELIAKEQEYLIKYDVINNDNFYNMSYGNEFSSSGGCIFNKFPEKKYNETCDKISNSLKSVYSSSEGEIIKQKIRSTLWDNLNDDEKEAYRKISSENARKGWAKMSKEKRDEFKKKCATRTDDKNPAARSVLCVETGVIYKTIKNAIDAGYKGNIGKTCIKYEKGDTDAMCGGYHWRYADNKGILKVREKKKYVITKKRKHYVAKCIETGEIKELSDLAIENNCSISKIRYMYKNKEVNGKHWIIE